MTNCVLPWGHNFIINNIRVQLAMQSFATYGNHIPVMQQVQMLA